MTLMGKSGWFPVKIFPSTDPSRTDPAAGGLGLPDGAGEAWQGRHGRGGQGTPDRTGRGALA